MTQRNKFILHLVCSLLLCLFIGPGKLEAKERILNCTLNQAADKKSLGSDELSRNVKSFSYKVDKEVGKNIELSPYKLIIWKKSPHINVKFLGGDFKKPLTVQFSEQQEKLRFNYGTTLDFQCSLTGQTSAQKAMTLGPDKRIDQFQEKVTFEAANSFKFTYNQSEETQMMRTIFFQSGKIFVNSEEMERKLPWCSLRVQLKRNEDTTIKKGESFSPVSFQKQENNTYFTTYSYSFVDFSSGKKVYDEHLYTPFMLRCNILRGMPYKLDIFKAIVGSYLTIKSNL